MNRKKIANKLLDNLPDEGPLPDAYMALREKYIESWDFLLSSFRKAIGHIESSPFSRNMRFIQFHEILQLAVTDVIMGVKLTDRQSVICSYFTADFCRLIIKYDVEPFKGEVIRHMNKSFDPSIIKKLLPFFNYGQIDEIVENRGLSDNLEVIVRDNEPLIVYLTYSFWMDNYLFIWDPFGIKSEVKTFGQYISAMATTLNNEIIVGLRSGLLIFKDEKIQAHTKKIEHLFALDHLIISISDTIKIWDGDECIDEIPHSSRNFCLLPGGFVYGSSNGNLFYWDIKGKNKESIISHSAKIYLNCVEKLFDNKVVFLTFDHEIGTWDLKQRVILRTFVRKVSSMKVLKDKNLALLIKGKVHIWDMNTKNTIKILDHDKVEKIDVSDKFLITQSKNETKIWN